jgi:transposase
MVLSPELQAKILQLHFTGRLSRRQIANSVGVDRKTVAAVIERRRVLLSGSERAPRASILAPYYPAIDKLLGEAPARSAVNILQHLREAGYQGGISILRDHLRAIRPEPPKEAFFELDFAPGEAAQVDWGEFGDVFGDGTKVHAFVMVLCFSRLLYLEFTLRETLPTLLRCYERALRFFCGLCKEYWHDNMPTVVAERLGRLRRFTEGFLAYVGFHGFDPVLCNVGQAHEKGRVEDGVKLVRNQFWPGRRAVDIDDLNRQAVIWRDRYANRREHEATGKVPELVFEQERPSLLPLRPEHYDTDDVVTSKVPSQFRVRFEGNRYSVPWTLVDKPVIIRADDSHVRVYYGHKRVAQHRRCYLHGKTITNPAHEEGLKELKPSAERSFELTALASFGPNTERYMELIGAGTRSLRAEIRQLLCLGTVYGTDQVEDAIGELFGQGHIGAARLERLLRLRETKEVAPPPLELHDERLHFMPPAPTLTAHDALLLDARRGVESAPAVAECGGEPDDHTPQQEDS